MTQTAPAPAQENQLAATLAQLGATIKDLRKARKLSRADFGEACGVAERTLLNIEQGRGCTLDSLMRILYYTGLDRDLLRWLSSRATDLC